MAAAVAAAENSATVILMGRRSVPGDNTVFAEGLFAVESPLRERMKVTVTKDEFFKQMIDFSDWKVSVCVLRAFIDKSGDTVRWLEEKSIKFILEPLFVNQSPLIWHCSEYGGSDVVKLLVKDCKKLGVCLLYKTRARKLLTDKSGTITGITAVAYGEEIEVKTKSVIIATGGFGANKELLKKYCPFYNEQIENTGLKDVHMGYDISMAADIGAVTEGMDNLRISGTFFPLFLAGYTFLYPVVTGFP